MVARRLTLLGLLVVVLGCTEEPGGAPLPVASPLRAPVSARDLSGNWVFGERREPPAGAVSTCDPTQSLTLTQSGEATLSGDVTSCGGKCVKLESFEGTNQDGLVQATGQYKGNLSESPEPVAYLLRYDATTQHLTGTRNGRPFWAAPWVTPSPGCD